MRQAIGFALAALLASACFAQDQGRLTGTVGDTTGAVVAGAEITAVNRATGVSYRAASNTTGTYVFPQLPPGTYSVTCRLDGFKSVEHREIILETRYSRTIDFQLEVGQVTERVEVAATTPLLESENAGIGQLVDRNKMMAFPLRDRRSGGLVLLAPGVVSQNPTSENVSVAGGRGRNQNYLIDGISNINSGTDLSISQFNPPAESIQEFKVEINSYTADLGRSSGGVISATTRAGTNEFHGSGYWFVRDDAFDARSFYAAFKEPLRFHVTGGSLGGPIIRNKTFFFTNYEYQDNVAGQTFSSEVVPHPRERIGDFSARRDVSVLDPVSRTPFPGNIIPQSRIDPVARQLVSFFPEANIASNDVTRAPRNNFLATGTSEVSSHNIVTRLDHNLGDKNRLFFRFLFFKSPTADAVAWPDAIQAGDPRARRTFNKAFNYAGSWSRNFTPNLVNDFRFGVIDQNRTLAHVGANSGTAGKVGLANVDPAHFPRLLVAGLSTLGDFRHLWVFDKNTNSLHDTLTWIRGRHQIKAGFDYIGSLVDNDDTSGTTSGTFTFNNRATNEGLAAFLLGWTSAASTNAIDYRTLTDYWGLFVTDDWKVTSKLTVNLGVRWELDTPPSRQNNELSGFDPNGLNPVSGTRGVVTFTPFPEIGTRAFQYDLNNFGPRFGFAWRPRDSWVVRGGYGISYDKPWRDVARGADASYTKQRDFTSPDGGFTPSMLFKDGLPPPVAEQRGPGFGAVRPGQAVRFAPDYYVPNQRTPYMQQWDFSIQKQLPGNSLAEAVYMANVGHKLYGEIVNYNVIPLVNGRGPARQDQLARLYPQFGNVSARYPTWGNSSYHAMIVKFQKRYSNGLSLLSHYTWSKFLDDVILDAQLGASSGLRHPELRQQDKGLSGNHLGGRFVTAAVWDLPFGKQRRFAIQSRALDMVAGGWTIAPFVEWHSGAVFAVDEQTNRTNTFGARNRPNALRNPVLSGGGSKDERLARWFDTSAFAEPAVGEFGNGARAYCCGPGLFQMDASVQKDFRFSEKWKLQFRSEFFNLFNHPNFSAPQGVRGRGDFGRVTSVNAATTPRQVQFALRVEF